MSKREKESPSGAALYFELMERPLLLWSVKLVQLAFLPVLVSAQRVCPVDKTFLRVSMPSVLPARQVTTDTLWVPLAIHVVENEPYELPDSRIGAQLKALNRDFAQARIQFYLPRYGPNGQPTCGVTRTVSPLASHDWMTQEDSLKNLIRWDPDSFINIWIVSWMPMQVIGYARALGDTVSPAGLVLLAEVVGDGEGVRIPYDRGRTAVHEMGHVFSLLHPFEGGCRGTTPQTCAIEGDEICDTPPQRQPHYGCPSPATNTCTETPEDFPDPVDNLMGYVDDSCMTRFTALQVERMRLFLLMRGTTLISEANRQARGFYEALAPECATVAMLPTGDGASRPPLLRTATTLKIPHGRRIFLYDVWGRLIRHGEGEELSLAGLPAGIYYLRVETAQGLLYYRYGHPAQE